MHQQIVFWGNDEWHGPRKRTRHLATGLASKYQVVYVNPVFYSLPGFLRDTLRGKSHRSGVWKIETVSSSLTVVSFPPLLPKGPIYPPVGRLNYWLLLPLIRRTLRSLGIYQPILWLTSPIDRWLIGKLGESLAVYDCMDLYAHFFEGVLRQHIANEEAQALRDVDLVMASSAQLARHSETYNQAVYTVRNGVDMTTFSLPIQRKQPSAAFRKTVIGYMGLVGAWVDVELLVKVAHSFPDATLALVGPVVADVSALEKLDNVVFLGEQPYDDLAGFVNDFDVCLIPFCVNDLTRAVNPIKVYEYFALGKPVVSMALPELEQYRDAMYLASTQVEFVSNIQAALGESVDENSDLVSMRRQIAMANTWERRVHRISQVLDEHTMSRADRV